MLDDDEERRKGRLQTMMPIIEFENVSVQVRAYTNPTPTLKETFVSLFAKHKGATSYAEFFALRDVNLKIYEGERVGILGLNGAGKSTMLKVIAGIYRPHTGRVIVRGEVTPLLETRAAINPELTGRDNIYQYGAIHCIPAEYVRSKEQEIIDFSELGDFINVPAKYYSTGMFSRLVFSIATMIDPDILIIDEVFSAGDSSFVEKATNRLLGLLDKSRAVFFVSHNIEQVLRICDRILVLQEGRVINDGPSVEMAQFYKENIISKRKIGMVNRFLVEKLKERNG
jgi:ABC-2 type transport system ATP-binding protein